MRAMKLGAGLSITVAVLALTATPAFATTYGSGSHNGSTMQVNTKLSTGCFKTVGDVSIGNGYTGSRPTSGSTSVSDGTSTYTGSVNVSWGYSFYQTFAGSTTDSTCSTLGTGASGSANTGVMQSSRDGGAGLSCSWTNGTYARSGTGTSALTIDFPAASGGCSVEGDTTVPMHWIDSGGFNQLNGAADCKNKSSTHPPTGCSESFTFTLTS